MWNAGAIDRGLVSFFLLYQPPTLFFFFISTLYITFLVGSQELYLWGWFCVVVCKLSPASLTSHMGIT